MTSIFNSFNTCTRFVQQLTYETINQHVHCNKENKGGGLHCGGKYFTTDDAMSVMMS